MNYSPRNRISRELKIITESTEFQLISYDEISLKSEIKFIGPKNSPFNKEMVVNFYYNYNYPFTPPKVYFKTPIYHPNVTDKGRLFLTILDEHWSPASTTYTILIQIVSLLNNFTCEEYINKDALDLWKNNIDDFTKINSSLV